MRSGCEMCVSEIPWSGMCSLQGRETGEMECWYTRADRDPANVKKMWIRNSGQLQQHFVPKAVVGCVHTYYY